MSIFYLHMAFGVLSSIVNNVSNYFFHKDVISTNIYSKQDNKIIGTWNSVTVPKTNKTSQLCTLSSLFKITSESKCTKTMIYKYAFTLGKLVTTYYYWMKMSDEESVYISFTESGLYSKW